MNEPVKEKKRLVPLEEFLKQRGLKLRLWATGFTLMLAPTLYMIFRKRLVPQAARNGWRLPEPASIW